jgi:hypothetical protein
MTLLASRNEKGWLGIAFFYSGGVQGQQGAKGLLSNITFC